MIMPSDSFTWDGRVVVELGAVIMSSDSKMRSFTWEESIGWGVGCSDKDIGFQDGKIYMGKRGGCGVGCSDKDIRFQDGKIYMGGRGGGE